MRLRSEARSNDEYRHISTVRAQVDVNRTVWPNLSLVSSTQALRSSLTTGGWQESVRQLSGIELPFRTGRFSFTARSSEEHFFQPGKDYDRFRQRALLHLPELRWQPKLGAELFLDREGWATTRVIAGLMPPCGRGVRLNAGYYYEFRPTRQGGSRHVIFTYLRFRSRRG